MPETPAGPAIKTVLFDLDGTLVHSAPDLHVAANKLLAEAGRRPLSLDETIMMIGNGVPKLVERAFEATGEAVYGDHLTPLTTRFLAFYLPHAADLTELFPGALECLQRLKKQGYRLALCTNKPYAPALEVLNAFGLTALLDAVIGGDSLPGIKKPDPRHLQAALGELKADAASAVMIGDNVNDVRAARAAGLPAVVCRHGYTQGPAEDLGGDAVIEHLDQLPAVFANLPAA